MTNTLNTPPKTTDASKASSKAPALPPPNPLLVALLRIFGTFAAITAALCTVSTILAGLRLSASVKRGDTGFTVVWGAVTTVCAIYAVRLYLAYRKLN